MTSATPYVRMRTVLFDLDGTLADTAPDLANALNEVLRSEGRPALPFTEIRPVVSHGARGLLRLGFGIDAGDPAFDRLRSRLLDSYQSRISDHTRLFPGIAELLADIEARGMNWGVVTNKPAWLTEPLLQALGVAERAACIVSGDTLNERKPHPAPMLYACRLAGSEGAQCVYVGDAERDIQAGRAAGMHTLVALFGYLGADDRPEQWGADALVENPAAIKAWLTNRRG